MENYIDRIRRRWIKLRLQPIRVYCVHHVSAILDSESMAASDWMQIDEFKSRVFAMQLKGVEFISMTEAYRHICGDSLRCKKYAVLSFDDGYASLKEILPWLEEQHIHATLFINGKYLDGKSYRNNPNEKYLTEEELFALTSPYIEIGSHGWEHVDASMQTIELFEDSFKKSEELLKSHPRYVPFYAYAYGQHTSKEDQFLRSMGKVPVLVDGQVNYNEIDYIHRESL